MLKKIARSLSEVLTLKEDFSSREKIFILGMGAQKSGTTWLYHYLKSRQDFDSGFVKEYAVLNYLQSGENESSRKRLALRRQNLKDNHKKKRKIKEIQLNLEFLDDMKLYFDYFQDILSSKHVLMSADLTPYHCSLSADNLKFVQAEFAARDITVIPVFLMREPVARLNSAVRMDFRNSGIIPTYEQELEAMSNRVNAIHALYSQTYQNITEVFGERSFIGFYETLFQDSEIVRLCDVLGCEYRPANFDFVVNESVMHNRIKGSEIQRFREVYASQYAFARDTFGEEFIDSIWST